MKRILRKVLLCFGGTLLCLALAVIVYIAYVFLSYNRIEDNQELKIENASENYHESAILKPDTAYTAVTYNIGFGAYLPDFSFFMDGGKSSWGKSKESIIDTVNKAGELTLSLNPDFALLQEIDLDGTRSYHVNQYDILKKILSDYSSSFGVNYDSPFLMYPLTEPHGKNKAGLSTFSKFPIKSSLRRSLPISDGFSKFMDLDRCYTISRFNVDNGKELVVFNLHLSAYGNSDEIRKAQVDMLSEDLKKEYAAGNYVLCGGDFNHDLKASENDTSNRVSWAYPFPRKSLPEHFTFAIDEISKFSSNTVWNSARNADMPFIDGTTYTVTLDGFIVSDNIQITHYEHKNTGYSYSDHEPVILKFKLKK